MTKAGLSYAAGIALCASLFAPVAAGANAAAPVGVRHMELGGDRVRFTQIAGLFGESDEDKAARLQHEQNQDDAISALSEKVRDLEDTVRHLTGESEMLAHRVQQLSDKIDLQKKDFEYRLCAMAAGQLGTNVAQGDANALPCAGTDSPGSPGGNTMSYGAPAPQADLLNEPTEPRSLAPLQRVAPSEGVLGTLPAETGAMNTQSEFTAAMNLLAKARYNEASAAFRGFADDNPKDDLAPQAVYWIGDIAYVQKDYDNATRAFAELIKKYPNSGRAPDSMLKLGQSLIASGQKKEGCTALAALPAKYPHASAAVLSQGGSARKAVCRGVS